MNPEQISQERLELIRTAARALWKAYIFPNDLKRRVVDISRAYVNPLLDQDAEIAVWGSGSFSTGEFEIAEAMRAKKELGFLPNQYVIIISNKRDSNAKKVADKFDLPLALIDFEEWYRANYNKNSKSPIKETGLFFPPGSELPTQNEIEHRFKIRKEFEAALLDSINDLLGIFPNSHSLRGYSFPIMHEIGQIDDTHPADLSYVDEKGIPLYPGWQSGAVELMVKDGHKIFRGSLINVYPMTKLEQVTSVDTGELLMLGGGFIPEQQMTAKEIQNAMKITEDYIFCATKAWGLFPVLWGLSEHNMPEYYRGLLGDRISVDRRLTSVHGNIMSGESAFGQNLKSDLDRLLLNLEVF